jgi:hypothetical protein
MKTRPTFTVSVKLWLHSDMYIWVNFSWTQRILRVYIWVPSGPLGKEQGSPELISDYGAQTARLLRLKCIGTVRS